jgi:aryl-phospho-beta-D-glucosidase BglC (GH1 family)
LGKDSPALVRVSGNHFVDGSGAVLQLRGVNVSGLEFVAVQGWSAVNPWGGGTGDPSPNWNNLKSWRINAVRIPLNEASWLGYKCTKASGDVIDPDPGHNYQATVARAVTDASAAGFYVILDLHWTAPGKFCPLAQNAMADSDNSIEFWTRLATAFKSRPNVMFELFNEPYFWWLSPGESSWGVLRNGGTVTQYVTGDGSRYKVSYPWRAAGMQQMLDAIRATGATNVVLIGAPSWCQDLSDWVKYAPNDPLKQIAAVWHAYPNSDKPGDVKAAEPKFGKIAFSWAQNILDAGYPLVITEFGDRNAPGTEGAPFVSQLLPWADRAGASYLGWTWDVWQNADNVLIKDRAGTPTDGYGRYVKAHLLCVADQKLDCP